MKLVEPDQFEQEIINSDKKTTVLFYADWCPFCANFKPTFEQMDIPGTEKKATLLNEDENPLWDRFNIESVPTVITFENGQIIARKDAKMGVGLTKADMDSLRNELEQT